MFETMLMVFRLPLWSGTRELSRYCIWTFIYSHSQRAGAPQSTLICLRGSLLESVLGI